MFIDKATIHIQAGSGGDGSAAFRREKFIPKGGPNGGDGGRGGDVYLLSTSRLRTLLDFVRKPSYVAPSGLPGSGYLKSGQSGDDLILEVPCGTSVYKGNTLIADLLNPEERLLVAKAGRGGRGNVHFKNSVRQAPRIAEKGEPGEKIELTLRLKVIADVGLIGMPNAGKSTLLSRLTRANPKIASYPFTTLYPNLGVAIYHNREIVFADIPGLIEGSHTGKGLGHEFLAHIERTRVLVHVVDPLGFGDKDAKANIKIINNELKTYSKTLAKKKQIIVINKQDLSEGKKVFKDIKRSFKAQTVLAVSGVTGEGIADLLAQVAKLLDSIPHEKVNVAPQAVHVNLEPDFWVEKTPEGLYCVKGKKVERLVAMTNFKLPEAVVRTQNILKKIGVERELLSVGAKSGDGVKILDFEFDFKPEIGFQNPPPRRPPRR
ncbi:MAG: GTPase Obg [Elusimicrobia bacterium]|nr:GTPase Obg [Elusimicrobiota bacterium]